MALELISLYTLLSVCLNDDHMESFFDLKLHDLLDHDSTHIHTHCQSAGDSSSTRNEDKEEEEYEEQKKVEMHLEELGFREQEVIRQ